MVEGLIRSRLLDLSDFDLYLANWMENGRNEIVVEFVLWIIQRFVLELKIVEASELPNSLDLLYRLVSQYQRSGLKPNNRYARAPACCVLCAVRAGCIELTQECRIS